MKKIGEIIEQALPSRSIAVAVRASRVYSDWEVIVGKMIADNSWPHSYRDGTIVVATESPVWGMEIRMASETILAKLNEKAGERLFKELRVIIDKQGE